MKSTYSNYGWSGTPRERTYVKAELDVDTKKHPHYDDYSFLVRSGVTWREAHQVVHNTIVMSVKDKNERELMLDALDDAEDDFDFADLEEVLDGDWYFNFRLKEDV